MNPNHPKQQHSVPQMLLRNFCDDSGRLWVSNGSKTWKCNPKNVFVEKDLYTNFRYERSPDTQDLEEFVRSTPRTYEYEEHLGRIESEATPAIRRIITQARRRRCPEFTPEARYACLRFLLAQFRRTPESQRRTAGDKNFDEIFYEENAVIAKQRGVTLPDITSFYEDPRARIHRNFADRDIDAWFAAGTHPRERDQERRFCQEIGLCVAIIRIPNRSFVIGSHGIGIVESSDNGSHAKTWMPIAYDVGIGLTSLPHKESLFLIDSNSEGEPLICMINKASAEGSRMIAGRSETLVRSLMEQLQR